MVSLIVRKLWKDGQQPLEMWLDALKVSLESFANGQIDSEFNIQFTDLIHFSLNSNDRLLWTDSSNTLTIVSDAVNVQDITSSSIDFKTVTTINLQLAGANSLSLVSTGSTLTGAATIKNDLNVTGINVNLNSDVTGAPTEDVTIKVERGTSADALLKYDEVTNNEWQLDEGGGLGLGRFIFATSTMAVALKNFTDTVFTFNSDEAGVPSANIILRANRGTDQDTEIWWDETTDKIRIRESDNTVSDIKTGDDVISKVAVVTYTGNGTIQVISGVGFAPKAVILTAVTMDSEPSGPYSSFYKTTSMAGTLTKDMNTGGSDPNNLISSLDGGGFTVDTNGSVGNGTNRNGTKYTATCFGD